ncbi:MAG: EAL domain-containing protein [Piscinibacter sp.]|uniref:EAL domain-containing protein n=1 Tax=Piscinibacter sp. TaxID=1903157 RepID=UPI003D1163DD
MPALSHAADGDDTLAGNSPQGRLRRLRALNGEAEVLKDRDMAAAFKLAVQAEALARELGANGELALALVMQGKAAFYEQRIDDALQLGQRAAELAEAEGHPGVRAKVLSGLGAMWASLGMGEQALPHLEAAAEQLAGSPDVAGLALVQSLLGGVLAQTHQLERGREQLEQALTAFTQLGMSVRACEARHNLACLANLQGRYEVALALSEVSSAETRLSGDWNYAHVEATACDALVGLGRCDEATERARRALTATPDPSRASYDLHLALGRAELAQGRFVQAREALSHALGLLERGGRPDDPLLSEAWAELRRRCGEGDAAAPTRERGDAGARADDRADALRWRLKALEASVELQAARLRYGRVAAERARLSAQLEHSRRLLAAELGARPAGWQRDATCTGQPSFDPAFDGESAGYALRYQPTVNLADGHLQGFEALLRLASKPARTSAPLEFLRRLEASGEIVSVGHWVLRRACSDLVALQANAPHPLRLTINVSRQELERPGFAEGVLEVLAAAGLPAARLELDVDGFHDGTAGGSMMGSLQRLRSAGVGITLDNFGSSQMPLGLLAELPLSRLKIDRSVVATLGQDGRHDALMASMLQTAANLHLAVSAAGIEVATQWSALRRLGCDEGQGFLFATPLPLDAAQRLPRVLPATA